MLLIGWKFILIENNDLCYGPDGIKCILNHLNQLKDRKLLNSDF